MLHNKENRILKIVIYVVCILLAIISIMPFWIMIMNATRSTTEIQQHANFSSAIYTCDQKLEDSAWKKL